MIKPINNNSGRRLNGSTPFGVWDINIDTQPVGDVEITDSTGKVVGRGTIEFATPDRSEHEQNRWVVASKRIAHGVTGMAKLAAGVDIAKDEVVAARLKICESCDQLTKSRQCGEIMRPGKHCGCLVDKKTKLAHERCPFDKW